MGLFSQPRALSPPDSVNHQNRRGTWRNPAWDTPSDGEKCGDLVSTPAAGKAGRIPSSPRLLSLQSPEPELTWKHKGCCGCPSAGAATAQPSPLDSDVAKGIQAELSPACETQSSHCSNSINPALQREKKSVFLLPYLYPLHFT